MSNITNNRQPGLAALLGLAVGLVVVAGPAFAQGPCVSATREVELAGGKPGEGTKGKRKLAITGQHCRTTPEGAAPEVRIEVLRLPDLLASNLVGGHGGVIKDLLVSPLFSQAQVLKTDTTMAWAELLARHGSDSQLHDDAVLEIGFSNARARDGVAMAPSKKQVKFRSVVDIWDASFGAIDYPLPEAGVELARQRLPAGFKYTHLFSCMDDTTWVQVPGPTCSKVERVETYPWRHMVADDLVRYDARLRQLNASIPRKEREEQSPERRRATEKILQLLATLTRERFPEDLLVLKGTNAGAVDSCETAGWRAKGRAKWEFQFYPLTLALDVVVVENTSAKPMTITGLDGQRSAERALRRELLPARPAKADVSTFARKLAPGERLIIPTRIVVLPSLLLRQTLAAYATTAKAIDDKDGPGSMQNAAGAFAVPRAQAYVWGPEIAIAAVRVDGRPIELPLRRKAQDKTTITDAKVEEDDAKGDLNEIDVVAAASIGSCPYLLARDDATGDWTGHGKVLHRADAKRREYTEEVTIDGWRDRFRLEEREAEIAHIDAAVLTVVLRDGREIALRTADPELAERDQRYARFVWGEAIEFDFALPVGVAAADIATSRLAVTGFYRRYGQLVATRRQALAAAALTPMPWRVAAPMLRDAVTITARPAGLVARPVCQSPAWAAWRTAD